MESRRDVLPAFFAVIGAVTAAAGIVPLLASMNVIAAEREAFGAPRWIVALFALAFVAVGFLLVFRALPSWRPAIHPDAPWIHRSSQVCAVIVVIGFFGGTLAFLNWKAFVDGDGSGAVNLTVADLPLRLPSAIARIPARLVVTLFAVLFDVLVVASIWEWLRGKRPR